MSAPKPRLGDIVRWLHDDLVGEVVAINLNRPYDYKVVFRAGCDPTPCRESELTLLRRPVQFGDVLTKPPSCYAVGAVDPAIGKAFFTASELPMYLGGSWTIHGMDIAVGGITHADGTPIDPPVSRTAETLPAPAPETAPPPTQRSGGDRDLRVLLVDRLGFELVTRGHGGARVIMYAGPNGWEIVEFELSGKTVRNGESLLTYSEKAARRQHAPPAAPPITEERLARALWETDPEVTAFVLKVSDLHAPSGVRAKPEEQDLRFERALETAWTRDELGARTRWTAIATAAVERLRGGR